MVDYKKRAAEVAFGLIRPGQAIGLGDGSTVLHLVEMIAADAVLVPSLTLTSSSGKTMIRMEELGLTVIPLSELDMIDIYFDGCDQFDRELNAFKSGAGIHTTEKILAGMAGEFILMGDSGKFSECLTVNYPVVVEVIPAAISSVILKLEGMFLGVECTLRPSLSGQGNHLVDLRFNRLPELSFLNTTIKMLPGVVDHSLFFRMAGKAVIAGPEGTAIMVSQIF
jgi:ribose 5-phosphate isomerase A